MSVLQRLRPGGEEYPSLTGIRALGASVVFFQHFTLSESSTLTLNVMGFFYVLSGFLIFRIYFSEAPLTGPWLRRYFINRFARIYPIYWLLLTVAVVIHHETRPWVLITNYTLTHALFHPSELLIEPTWSLTVEECFYVLAPLFMLVIRRGGFPSALGLGWGLLILALGVAQLDTRFMHGTSFVLTTTFFGHVTEFLAGVLLALSARRLEPHPAGTVRTSMCTFAGAAGCAAALAAMDFAYAHTPPAVSGIILVGNFIIPVPIALLYWGLMRERSVLAKLLACRLVGLLGRASYTFYILRTLIIHEVAIPLLIPRLGSRVLCVVLSFIGTWVLSVVLFVAVEEPMNIAIRRALGR